MSRERVKTYIFESFARGETLFFVPKKRCFPPVPPLPFNRDTDVSDWSRLRPRAKRPQPGRLWH